MNTYATSKYDPRTTRRSIVKHSPERAAANYARHIRSQITTAGNWRPTSADLGHTLRAGS